MLRSTEQLYGYRIQATDAEVGEVADFFFDDAFWMVRYLVVDMHEWLPSKQVPVATEWVDAVDWTHATVHLDVTTEMVEGSPAYNPTAPITRGYEKNLYDYYARPKYWM